MLDLWWTLGSCSFLLSLTQTQRAPAVLLPRRWIRGALMTEYPHAWTCEVTVFRLEGYVRGTLDLADALAIAEHVEACAPCALLLMLMVDHGPAGTAFGTGGPRG